MFFAGSIDYWTTSAPIRYLNKSKPTKQT